MKLSESLRNTLFWSLDALTGGKKKYHYNQVRYGIENPNDPEVVKEKKNNLQNILKHAVESVTHYSDYEGYNSIEDFPVVNKNSIRNHFKDFQSKKYENAPKFEVSTSGSTGTPFKVFQDARKRLRNTADNIFFSELAGFRIGYKLTYFRLWNAFEKKSLLDRLLQNIEPIDVFDLSKKGAIGKVVKDLQKSNASNSWLGYASAYHEICKYLDTTNPIKISTTLKSAIAISEKLNPYTKQAIKHHFGTEVVSRYSNVENGIIAQQPLGGHEYFIINEASYYIEILDVNTDKVVKDGIPGRIVVTDLFNYAMPMIRYDTGDIGIKGTIDSKAVLTKVEGRKIDIIYDTSGNIVPVNLVLIVNKYPELKQSQLIQKTRKKYHFKLNADNEFLREEEFLNEFKVYLGEDAEFTVEYVNEIPLLASGKRRVMINEMINS